MIKKIIRIYLLSITVFSLIFIISACDSAGGSDGTGDENLGGGGSTAVTLLSVEQRNGSSGTADSSLLVLTFDIAPATLTDENITVTGATKGSLYGFEGRYNSLDISDITAGDGETVSVEISSPEGYTITGSPQTAVVYRDLDPGMSYKGGKITYIFESGDSGYVSGETHGLIAAEEDLSSALPWKPDVASVPATTLRSIGSGSSNTDALIEAYGSGDDYAAGAARAYRGGGYTDWFLPSEYEIFANTAVSSILPSSAGYWSSSLYINSYVKAFLVTLDYSSGADITDTKLVRPFRYF